MKMNLKKAMKILLIGFVLLGAAFTAYTTYKSNTQPEPEPHANLTVENIVDQCEEPELVFPISAFNLPIDGILGRHKNCLGVPDLILVIWNGKDTELNRTGAKMITLMLVNFEDAKRPDVTLTPRLLKIMPMESRKPKVAHVAFYEVHAEKVTQEKTEQEKL